MDSHTHNGGYNDWYEFKVVKFADANEKSNLNAIPLHLFYRVKIQKSRKIKKCKGEIMVRVIKDICKVRDILATGDDKKISNPRYADASGLYERTAWKIRDVIKKKSFDKDYEIDITSQDLRELAQDIKAVFKRWDDTLDADTNIKWIMNSVENGTVDMNKVRDRYVPIMIARVNTSRYLVGLLNIAEYMAVFLYALEDALVDEFALKYTERIAIDK